MLFYLIFLPRGEWEDSHTKQTGMLSLRGNLIPKPFPFFIVYGNHPR